MIIKENFIAKDVLYHEREERRLASETVFECRSCERRGDMQRANRRRKIHLVAMKARLESELLEGAGGRRRQMALNAKLDNLGQRAV